MLKNFQKYVKIHHIIAFLGLLVLIIAIGQYSNRLGGSRDGMDDRKYSGDSRASGPQQTQDMNGAPLPAAPAGQNEEYASVSGMDGSNHGLAPSCGSTANPDDLLPKDVNSEWARLNPSNGGDFMQVNLLKSGYHIGIDTIGSSLRNANLQERSEPPNPTTKVSPWMQSTIDPDLMRTPLEIGGQQ